MSKENFAVEGHALPFRRMMFEITRRCNLCCAHCFRGNPQNVDISEEIIDKALDQISSCFSFDVTGGEPFLVPDKLEYLVDGIIKKKMRFTSFSLVVNGTILDDRAQRSVAAIGINTRTGSTIGTQSKESATDTLEKMRSESSQRVWKRSLRMRRKAPIDIFELTFYSIIK